VIQYGVRIKEWSAKTQDYELAAAWTTTGPPTSREVAELLDRVVLQFGPAELPF